MLDPSKNIVVVGGSYVGKATAELLAGLVPSGFRVLLVEPHTHFHHIFVFPRFAIVPGQEHKAFIPYSNTFASAPDPGSHAVVPARVTSVGRQSLTLDRKWRGASQIPFEYLVVATGTILTPPNATNHAEKAPSVHYLRKHQDQVKAAKSVLIVGGGAAGVQMAADIKEYYPEKQVTVVQSRDRLMPKFHAKLHELIKKRFDELGINLITGARVVIPEGGFPDGPDPFDVHLSNGAKVSTEFIIRATGQTPNNSLVADLEDSKDDPILNPANGMIRVLPTMQFSNPKYSNFFAVGDIADTGAHKAARPGRVQAEVAAKNIFALIEGRTPTEQFLPSPAAIHITLGMRYNVIFGNPNTENGASAEPRIVEKQDGVEDMSVENMWQRFGIQVKSPNDYHL